MPFFNRSEQGFRVMSSQDVLSLFDIFKNASIQGFIALLELINQLTTSEYEKLSDYRSHIKLSKTEGERLREVYDFTFNNYHRSICLFEVAELLPMSKTAFCKYFKRRTNKTYYECKTMSKA